MITDIYTAVVQCDIELDHHETDLYIPVNNITKKLINSYVFKCNVTTFINQVTKTLYYEIPFAYSPAWKERT